MEIPRHWRLRKQRYQMLGETCSRCGEKSFPGRAICPRCQEALSFRAQNDRSAVAVAELAAVRQTI
ncbi:MAG: hypothetical protein WHV66_07340 [Anaerolineales bacterium]